MSYPVMPRKLRDVGAPLGAIIALGTIAALILVLVFVTNPVGGGIAFVLTSIAMTVVVGSYLWLDRWEPEPPRLLVMAFLWGASVALIVALVVSLVFFDTGNQWISGVVGAPFAEEAAKGLFLLIMMTGVRRNELNSLTDCLVFAGLVGAGFGWIEDIFYIAGGGADATLAIAILRLAMGPFAHSLFCSFLGIGVYFALNQRTTAAKVGCILLGYLGAVGMHALWNTSAQLGTDWYFGIYVVWMMPVFATMIVVAVLSRRREQRTVAAKLPGMVEAGLISPSEAGWLGSMKTRNRATAIAKRFGEPAHGAVREFSRQVVSLAFVRDRIDRGFGDPRTTALFNEETQWLRQARVDAGPALAALANIPPAPGGYVPPPRV
ncbi:MAG: PrsW family intramembrane metalloprotease [Gordonia sp. (in: high G+C Gram-positive bacteria)]|uniref:PrsW family intramembrane metalloprotease n=1 Tax=Gordonia sp. (in: high G+C Gram-positive bacteria) TaxID=84139 RepID=UPI0039E33D64